MWVRGGCPEKVRERPAGVRMPVFIHFIQPETECRVCTCCSHSEVLSVPTQTHARTHTQTRARLKLHVQWVIAEAAVTNIRR